MINSSLAPVLELCDATVEVPGGHTILQHVGWELRAGEIHGLMGENGAGKSTLIRVLNGLQPLTGGSLHLDGAPVRFRSIQESRAVGIATVFQEAQLLPHLTVAENVMLGNEPRRRFSIDWRAMRLEAANQLSLLGLQDIDVMAQLSTFSVSVQQIVAIARAMVASPRVVLLDEPTAGLHEADVEQLFDVLRRMRDQGVAIVFASHFLEQAFAISDRITVLRDGNVIGTSAADELTRVELISQMLGSELGALQELTSQRAEHSEVHEGEPLLRAEGIGQTNVLRPMDLSVHQGEIVGLAGLRGSGRTEFAKLLSGDERPDQGTITLDGRRVQFRDPRAGLLHGLVLSPERRQEGGIIEGLSVEDNILLSLQALRGWRRPLPERDRQGLIRWALRAFDLDPSVLEQPVGELSGGQQQKVLLARLFVTKPRVLMLDEPTRGCDISARLDIQRLVMSIADQGAAVLLISSDLEELVQLADRIVVQKDREKLGELSNGPGVTVDTLVELIASSD